MQKIVNPKQIQLFDPFNSVLTPKTHKYLLDGWPGGFSGNLFEDSWLEHFAGIGLR